MGERLNLEIKENGKLLANAYYHWSGYTRSALELTQKVIEASHLVEDSNPLLRAIRLLEATEAGFTPEERFYANRVLKPEEVAALKTATSRNDGLIAISPEGMKDTQKWQEEYVAIDLGEQEISFEAVNLFDSSDYIENYFESIEEGHRDYLALPCFNFELSTVSFDQIDQLSQEIDEFIENGVYAVKLPSGEVCRFVE